MISWSASMAKHFESKLMTLSPVKLAASSSTQVLQLFQGLLLDLIPQRPVGTFAVFRVAL